MSNTNNGGPAFPFGQISELTGQPINGYHNDGMTLRDYMATHASDEDVRAQAEALRTRMGVGLLPDGWRCTARYMHADAMPKARSS